MQINRQVSKSGLDINIQAEYADEITKSDDTVYLPSTLYIGTAGNVSVVTASGTTVVFKNLANGSTLPVLVTKVLAATTADDLVIMR